MSDNEQEADVDNFIVLTFQCTYIRAWFIGGGCRGGTLPSTDID
jgi:hypothetical protein